MPNPTRLCLPLLAILGLRHGAPAQPPEFLFTPDSRSVFHWTGSTLQLAYAAPAGRWIDGVAADRRGTLYTNEVAAMAPFCPAILTRGGRDWLTLTNRCPGDVFVGAADIVYASFDSFCGCGQAAAILGIDASGATTTIYTAPTGYEIGDIAVDAAGNWFALTTDPLTSASQLIENGVTVFSFFNGGELFVTPSGNAYFNGNTSSACCGGDGLWFRDRQGGSPQPILPPWGPPMIVTGLAGDDDGNYAATLSDWSNRAPPYLLLGKRGARYDLLGPIAANGVEAGDVFMPAPTALRAYGASSPGCSGALTIGARSWPHVGNQAFSVTCDRLPAQSNSGALLLTTAPLSTPIVVLGAGLWVDPSSVHVLLGAASDPTGVANVVLPLPADNALVGGDVFAQFLWIGPTMPPPCPPLGLSASNALQITIQP